MDERVEVVAGAVDWSNWDMVTPAERDTLVRDVLSALDAYERGRGDMAARVIRGLLYNDEDRPQADIEAEAARYLSGTSPGSTEQSSEYRQEVARLRERVKELEGGLRRLLVSAWPTRTDAERDAAVEHAFDLLKGCGAIGGTLADEDYSEQNAQAPEGGASNV